MPITRKQKVYWRRNIRVTVLLAVWFVVTFVVSFFARELNSLVIFGFPFGFYTGSQGALLIYVLIIGFYARYMNSMDRKYGVREVDE